MVFGGVLRFTVIVLVMKIGTQIGAAPAKDSVQRKGIIVKVYSETERNDFKNEVVIDGTTFKQIGNKRERKIGGGTYMATIQRYEQTPTPAIQFDFVVLKDSQTGKFVSAVSLLTLKKDADLDNAIILLNQPSGLEFVMMYKECCLLKTGETTVGKPYGCGNDNYIDYV